MTIKEYLNKPKTCCCAKGEVRRKSRLISAPVAAAFYVTTCFFALGAVRRCRGLILLPSEEGHPAFSSHDDHRVVLKSGKTQPINYSRGRKGQSLAWNWARSYQSARAGEGDICLWDSLALSNSPAFQSLPVSPSPSVPVIEPSPFFLCTSPF